MNDFMDSSTDDTSDRECTIHKTALYTNWNDLLEIAASNHQENSKTTHGPVQFISEEKDPFCGEPHGTIRGLGVILKTNSNKLGSGFLPNSLADTNNANERNNALKGLNPAVLNCILLYQKNLKELKLAKSRQNGFAFVNDFILKLKNALKCEERFALSITGNLSNHIDADTASTSATDSENQSSSVGPKKLPKLGKVYAELRSCMKTCEEICISRPSAISRNISQKCYELQGKMLLHVRWLIEARLRNIGHFITANFDNENLNLDQVFCSNESKRFCKLFEVYNEYATLYSKNYGVNEVELTCKCGEQYNLGNAVAPTGTSSESYGRGMTAVGNRPRPSVIYPILVRSILDMLSESFMGVVGAQLSSILSSCQSSHPNYTSADSKPTLRAIDSGSFWEDAAKIEIRPVQPQNRHKSSFFRLIKRVGGINVPDIDTNLASEQCAVLADWFRKHEEAISSFISGLNGKTKILRRSINFQDAYLSDDTMSVASSESRSLSRHNETKTVVWRDSWSNDTMKSISAHYMEFLTNALPVLFAISSVDKGQNGSSENYYAMSDMTVVLLHAVVSNLGHLNVMSEGLHNSMLSVSTEVLVNSAVACSDNVLCEMLGKCTPSFDKPSIQKVQGTNVSLVTHLCLASLHPLLHVLEFYSQNGTVAKKVLPRVEAILNAGFWWIKRKIQEFFSTWSLCSLLQMCLCDLREVTNISLDCLRLVESCHNHIETKRNQNSAALLIATRYLHNIDAIITNMQVASGSCILQLGSKVKSTASKIIISYFPAQKFWLQKNRIDNEVENQYVKELIHSLLGESCSAVSDMNAQSQLAAMTPIINSIYDACLAHIAKLKVKFTMQGAMQLFHDFSSMITYIKSTNSGLSNEVHSALSSLRSVTKAMHVAELLQSTSFDNGAFEDDRFRPQSKIQSSTGSLPDNDQDDTELSDQFWLSLRKHNIRRSKTWTSFLPCVDKK